MSSCEFSPVTSLVTIRSTNFEMTSGLFSENITSYLLEPFPSSSDPTPPPLNVPLPTATSNPESRACFSATGMVELRGGIMRPMHVLQVGDLVRTSNTSFSPVLGFTHRDRSTPFTFLSITVKAKSDSIHTVLATPGHFLVDANGNFVQAQHVRLGDVLSHVQEGPAQVVRIDRTQRRGAYNPQTLSGSIVVDGIQATCYTRAIHPTTAHTLLLPLRILHELLLPSYSLVSPTCPLRTLRTRYALLNLVTK
mmetsp:Transcript_6356/g.12659  ORF Transcript_6356/g.12659 Transcript_6356/m.12659 type:complete len:251 (+) Transcript_6356:1184-1936(+)